MTPIAHYSILKLAGMIVWSLTLVAVLDPTIKGLIIAGIITGLTASIPPTISGLFTHWDTVKKLGVISSNVDGILSRKDVQIADKTEQLTTAKVDLSHAEGRREGIESTEQKETK